MPVENVPSGRAAPIFCPARFSGQLHAAAAAEGSSDAYLRMIHAPKWTLPWSASLSLTLKDGVCTTARVGLGAVAPTVLLVEVAAKALIAANSTMRR